MRNPSQGWPGILLVLLIIAPVACQEPSAPTAAKEETSAKGPTPTPLFSGVNNGQLEVSVHPHNHAFLTLRIKNKTSRELLVEPTVFAAVPVKKSAAPSPSTEDPQSLGSATSPVPPGESEAKELPKGITLRPKRTVRVRLPCFCLEFGKPDPNKKMTYELRELKAITDSPGVAFLMKGYAEGRFPHRSCQLAVWHVANGASWEKLERQLTRRSVRRAIRYSQQEIAEAKKIVAAMPTDLQLGQQKRGD